MSYLDNYIDERKHDKEFIAFWENVQPSVMNRVNEMMEQGATSFEAEKRAVMEVEATVENVIDEKMIETIEERKDEERKDEERKDEEPTFTIGEVAAMFNLDFDEIMRLAKELKEDEE